MSKDQEDRTALPQGVYDAPITRGLDARLSRHDIALREIELLDPSESPRALARLVHTRLVHALASFPTSTKGDEENDAMHRQIALTNALLTLLEETKHSGATQDDRIALPGRRLLAVRKPAVGLGAPVSPLRPELPLSSSDLLVNGRHDVSLGRG